MDLYLIIIWVILGLASHFYWMNWWKQKSSRLDELFVVLIGPAIFLIGMSYDNIEDEL